MILVGYQIVCTLRNIRFCTVVHRCRCLSAIQIDGCVTSCRATALQGCSVRAEDFGGAFAHDAVHTSVNTDVADSVKLLGRAVFIHSP